MSERISVLIVCTGNICRSPTAEGVLRHAAARRGMADRITVRSAGTHDYHTGERPDPRSIRHADKRGYDLSGLRASQVGEQDFDTFDYILAMDEGHLRILKSMEPKDSRARLMLFLDASTRWKGADVPDPYYGGPEGFEHVIDMVEDAAEGWLDRFEATTSPRS